jgi:hypothetical protein
MMKKTRRIKGFEVCVHFDNHTDECTLPKELRKCDGICTFVNKGMEEKIVIKRRKKYGAS